jgi:hypothetical protein
MENKYYFGKDFIHGHEKAWRRMFKAHPKENRMKPSIDFLCKLYKVCELSAKLYYEHIDDNVFRGEMEKLFPNNKLIDTYNDWANGLITTDEYMSVLKEQSPES